MPRLEVDIDEETRQGLVWAAVYYQLPLDETVNLLLLATLAEFTKLVIAQMEREPQSEAEEDI
jgi:hypothetical protein